MEKGVYLDDSFLAKPVGETGDVYGNHPELVAHIKPVLAKVMPLVLDELKPGGQLLIGQVVSGKNDTGFVATYCPKYLVAIDIRRVDRQVNGEITVRGSRVNGLRKEFI